jgi:hypothetical protein
MTEDIHHLLDIDFELVSDEELAEYLAQLESVVGDVWSLTPKQLYAEEVWGKVDWMLYGGAAGGAKSELAIHHANRLSLEIPGHSSLLVRRSIPELRRSLIVRLVARIVRYKIPAKYRKLDGQAGFAYQNLSLIECGHCQNDEDVAKYLSAEYDCIVVDEATTLTENQIIQIASRLRTTREKALLGARPHLGLFTNPGGVSHAWQYDLFITPTNYGQKIVVYDISQGLEKKYPVREYEAPLDVSEATPDDIFEVLLPWVRGLTIEADPETHLVVGFVPSKATDNPFLDPSYLKNLNTLPERRRKQLKDGDWDTFEGMFFTEFNRPVHVIEPFDIPESWQKARGIDYGSTAPYCCVWVAWDDDDNAYVYREDYEAGLTPQEQARRVQDLSVSWDGKRERYRATVADPSAWSNHRGMGKAISDMWRDAGLVTTKAKNQRVAGWANVRQYLWDYVAQEPRIYFFNTCRNVVRTLPLQQHAKANQEDLDTDGDDHAMDALRYVLNVRPISSIQRRESQPAGASARFNQMVRKADKRRRATRWSS